MNSLKASTWKRNIATRVSTLTVVFLFYCSVLNAQTPGLSLGYVGVCNDTTILVPLTGYNLSNIGAITLYINYDEQKLVFLSIENIDPQLSGLMANPLSNPARLSIVWSKTSGANFLNTTLFKIKFRVLQKPGNLNFVKDNCEIANISIPPQIITINYTDGLVFASIPTILFEPENKTIVSQSNAVFQVISPNALEFTWQESRSNGMLWSTLSETGTYSGTQTNTLTIKHVPANYNQFLYRCILSRYSCPAVSGVATLSVDSLTGIAGQLIHGILHLSNSPNPFSGKTTLQYTVPEYGLVSIKIYSMTGKIMGVPVDKPHKPGTYTLEDNFVYLPAGIYFCQYLLKSLNMAYETNFKMIKINMN
jgi:hypothetical protein